MEGRAATICSILPIVVLTLCWVLFKFLAFNNWLYRIDILTALDVSRNLFQGRWIWWSNLHGWSGAGHNFLFNILLGPLVLWWGAYGLFIASGILILVAGIRCVQVLRRLQPVRGIAIGVMIIVFFGPISFWLFDDIFHGWHVDQLYVPLGILLMFDVFEGKKRQWIWGFLIAMCREDGALVALVIHLMATSISAKRGNMPLICSVWVSALAVHLILLKIGSPLGSARLQQSVQMISELQNGLELLLLIVTVIGQWVALNGTLLIPFYIFLPRLKLSLAFPLVTLLLVHALACTFANWPYSNMLYNGTIFPSHFAAGWTFSVCLFCAGVYTHLERGSLLIHSRRFVLSLAVLSVLLQMFALYALRNYNVIDRVSAPFSTEIPNRRSFSLKNQAAIYCVRDKVQKGLSIKVSEAIYPAFHRHSLVNLGEVKDSLYPPELVLCRTGVECDTLVSQVVSHSSLTAPLAKVQGNEVSVILFSKVALNQISKCLDLF